VLASKQAHSGDLTWELVLSHACGALERQYLASISNAQASQRETGFRVFTDPVGHPFCIVFGQHSAA
jgi:hypothetical protein